MPLAEVGVEVAEAVLGPLYVGADAGLLGLQGRDVDGAAVVRIEELAPLLLGLDEPVSEQLALGSVGPLALDDLGRHVLAQALGPRARELDALVELFHLGFEVLGGDVAFPAGALGVVLLAQAEEVGVAALRVLDRQTPAAHPAVQQPLQVVGVLALSGPARGAGGQQLLDPAERLGTGERLVGALVLDAVPLHDPHVDRIGEDLGQALPSDGLGLPVAPSATREAPVGELLRQALEGPLAGGVGLEGERDERGTLFVEDDVGHLVAGDHLAPVHVAKGRAVGEAALLRLLAQALFDLGRQVGRVELGHEGVDAFHQATRGGLLHVLGHRDEGDALAAQERPDGHVVFHVACEPVDLVDDDGVHVVVFGDPGQHGLQGRAVG